MWKAPSLWRLWSQRLRWPHPRLGEGGGVEAPGERRRSVDRLRHGLDQAGPEVGTVGMIRRLAFQPALDPVRDAGEDFHAADAELDQRRLVGVTSSVIRVS